MGSDEALPEEIVSSLSTLSKEACEPLTVTQIKKVRALIDEEMERNKEALERLARERDEVLGEIANWLHPSVPISNDEVVTII